MECDNERLNKRCYRCTIPPIEDLYITHNPGNATTALWNRFQVFVYENFDFTSDSKIFVPEYQISNLLLTNNFLLCLDSNGNVHVTVLKFKSPTRKHLILTFLPRENNIKTFLYYKQDIILSLKYEDDAYFLCLNKLSTDFKNKKKSILIKRENWPVINEKGCIMIYTVLTDEILAEFVNNSPEKYQYIDRIRSDCDLILITLNNTIYVCIFGPQIPVDETELITLYTCPSEIKNIGISSHYVLISLSLGTVIRLNLKNTSAPPDIVHLNIAIHKLVVVNDNFIYTDGVTLWKTDNAFTDNIKFKDLSIKNVKDLSVYDDQIICTTYTKLIYLIPSNSGSTIEEMLTLARSFWDNNYIDKIFNEIDKNNELIKNLNKEQIYILANTLSTRQDIVQNGINSKVVVYDDFKKIQGEELELVYTEVLSQYFKPNIYIFLINLIFDNTKQQIYNILANMAEISMLNIAIILDDKILKIASIELEKNLKDINCIITLPMEKVLANIDIEIKIVTNIPGAFDERTNKTILYKNIIILRSEHFCRTPNKEKNKFKRINNIHNVVSNCTSTPPKNWSQYIRLPKNYKEIFKNIMLNIENLNKDTIRHIKQQLTNELFLNCQNSIIFFIGTEKVMIEILNDGFSEPKLMVSSQNADKALDIRQFLSKLIYNNLENVERFADWSFYAKMENFQKFISVLKKPEEIRRIAEMFEKIFISTMPI